jgi:hypothetical protein
MQGMHVTLGSSPPMPPPDADFAITIDFRRGEGNPRRVFDAASLLIEGFERFDETTAASIDSHIEPVLVLEDVEAGSLRIWLRNVLNAADDQALKELDWKPQVGKYLVRAKYMMLEWLDRGETGHPPSLSDLANNLRRLASETDIRHLPDYAPVHEGKLLGALDKIQDAKRQLTRGDRLYIETEGQTYEVDLARTWSPTAEIAPDSQRETTSFAEMILTVRKPDMIGNTQWQFRHGKTTISAPINDAEWLEDYHAGSIDIRPGHALRCHVKFVYRYDPTGALVDQRTEIEKVYETIRVAGDQDALPWPKGPRG